MTRSDRLLALGARVMNAAVALAIALAGISDAVRPHLGPIPRPFGQILIEVGLYGSFFGAAVAFAALTRQMARPRGVPVLIVSWILAFYARRFQGDAFVFAPALLGAAVLAGIMGMTEGTSARLRFCAMAGLGAAVMTGFVAAGVALLPGAELGALLALPLAGAVVLLLSASLLSLVKARGYAPEQGAVHLAVVPIALAAWLGSVAGFVAENPAMLSDLWRYPGFEIILLLFTGPLSAVAAPLGVFDSRARWRMVLPLLGAVVAGTLAFFVARALHLAGARGAATAPPKE